MQITKEFIETQIASIERQRRNGAEIVQQADGALAALRMVLATLASQEEETPVEIKGAELMDAPPTGWQT